MKSRSLTPEAREWLRGFSRTEGRTAATTAKLLEISRRHLFNIVSGAPLSPELEKRLRAVAAEVGVENLRLTGNENDLRIVRRETIIYSNRLLKRLMPLRRTEVRHEFHNLIVDKEIRERLLQLNDPPSLAEAISASAMYVGPKDTVQEAAGYNHFLHFGIVLDFRWPEQADVPVVLYERIGPLFDDYTKYPGMALRWSAQFLRNAYHWFSQPSPVDQWMEIVTKNPSAAESALLEGPNAILRRLFNYKVQLQDYHRTTITPLVISTNDKRRHRDTPRAHTAYVFRVSIEIAGEKNLDDELLSIPTSAIPISIAQLSELTPRSFGLGNTPKENGVNWVLVKALTDPKAKPRQWDETQYHVGFNLIRDGR